MGVIAEGIASVYSPACFWVTHYQFSIKTILSKKEIVMKLGTPPYILAKKCIVGLRTHCDCAP